MIETMPLSEAQNSEDEGRFWNGSLATLERIHNLICDITRYDVNGNFLGYRNNLKELYFETRGFLSKPERIKARKEWEAIESMTLIVDAENGTASYDLLLPKALDRFNSWLRLRLHRHNVTMAKGDLAQLGLSFQRKKYGLR
jgi:hypothetical protein